MTRPGRPRLGLRKLVPVVLLFILGQTWIILISLPYSMRQMDTKDRLGVYHREYEASRLEEVEDKKYTAELDTTLKKILAKHKNKVDTSNFKYNVSLGDSISVRRPIPDTRIPECKNMTFETDADLRVSVVVIFHDEALSTLVRTVHSVIDKSPRHLLIEVILVDDASTMSYLKDDLDLYLSLVPKARVIRNQKREGLIRSRMIGARNATGEVLVFFDAHMECNRGWLEPLLQILQEEPSAIVQPSVDVIAADTMEYYTYDHGRYRGGFGWDLRYAWFSVPEFIELTLTSRSAPFITPVLVGNAIIVRREHFFRIGGFDEGLDIWGGEHFDLSFKNWMCAGRILTVPCSKVGHLFRDGAQSYSFVGDRQTVIQKNLMRVAEIWMDEYKDVFYKVSGIDKHKALHLNQKSIKRQKHFLKSLNCKSFKWYLKNVLPEQKVPPQNAAFFGEITNVKTAACLAVLDDLFVGITYECFKYRILPDNSFTFTKGGEFKYNDYCVYLHKPTVLLKIDKCGQTSDVMLGKWKFQPEDSSSLMGDLRFEDESGTHSLCVRHVTSVVPNLHYNEQMPQAMPCNASLDYQKWFFMYRLS